MKKNKLLIGFIAVILMITSGCTKIFSNQNTETYQYDSELSKTSILTSEAEEFKGEDIFIEETDLIAADSEMSTLNSIDEFKPFNSEIDSLDIPAYSGSPYIEINGNVPFFLDDELTTTSFEEYGELDELERCTVTIASVGVDIMPTEERGMIGQIKPTGWHTIKYDFVDGKYLYNRCHLIGYQLTGENANPKNLITGTRYLNVNGMLPFENEIADYVSETENHVMYRVTPIFTGKNLLADGVLMEAKSVEDKGEGICFNIFCYNVQPGVAIDYITGESYEITETEALSNEPKPEVTCEYIINVNSNKFHYPDCEGVSKMKQKNKRETNESRETLISEGYKPCLLCNP